MSDVLVTASLIVKNEEKFLGSCLDSLKGVVDEVVVVDTGSTDRTKEIAKSGGARLYEFSWTGDFALARNRALELSQGEWILYIDADERLRPDSVSNLRTELAQASHIGYEVLLHPRPGHSPYWVLRLFRNDPSIRFRGMIHENIWPALGEYRAKHGGQVGKSQLVLDHEGYEGDQNHKHARNLPLLLESLKQDPHRVYSWCHLANIYMATEQPQLAEAAWRSALEVVRHKVGRAPEDILPYLGLVQRGFDQGHDINALIEEAFSRFGATVQLEWLRGRILMREGQFDKAIAIFQNLVARGQGGDYERSVANDFRLFTVFAYDALATCYFRLHNYAESRHYYDLAARQEPDRLEYRVKKALCERLDSASLLARP